MKAFTLVVHRYQMVKLMMGLAGIVFVIRMVMGITNTADLFGVSPAGFMEFVVIMIFTSVTLLLWDVRDRVIRR